MNKDLYEIISEKYNLKYNDYDYWKKYEYDDEEKMYDNTEVANSLDDYDCKKNDYSEILKEIVEKYKKSLTDEEVLERMNMNYHYTKDVVVSGTLGSLFLSVSWLIPNFLGFIFAPRS